jgi:DNA invertase Pin-like site-specific DNA recombinase
VLAEIVEDAGYSAKDLRRPGIMDLLHRLSKGEVGTLIVAKLDRLSRSLLDFSTLMEKSRREGWALVALDLGVDTTTPAGEMMANVLATFNQFERRLIGQRTKEALSVKRSQGVRLGRPRVLADEVVARILSEREEGRTLAAIATGLNGDGVPTAQGGREWHPSTVRGVVEAARVAP